MKNFTVCAYLAMFLIALPLFPAETINIPSGKPITVTGSFSTGEWADAGSLKMNLAEGMKITVFYKHDNKNLYLAYCSNLFSTTSMHCPEALFDINNDKSAAWMSDDWWFHVSATDCYSKGEYGDYSTCKPVQPDWEANNMMDQDFRDTVEVIIPFSTLGVEPTGNVKIGICFDGTDTQTDWDYWPAGADKNKPSGWAEAVFDFGGSEVNDLAEDNQVGIYPNPVTDYINFIAENGSISGVAIFTPGGAKLYEGLYSGTVDVSAFPTGLYFLRIDSAEGIEIKKFVISR